MTIEVKKDDTPEGILKKMQEIDDRINQEKIAELKSFFGIIKRDIDPLKLQKMWRDEWE